VETTTMQKSTTKLPEIPTLSLPGLKGERDLNFNKGCNA